jgi:hypothetical protein
MNLNSFDTKNNKYCMTHFRTAIIFAFFSVGKNQDEKNFMDTINCFTSFLLTCIYNKLNSTKIHFEELSERKW